VLARRGKGCRLGFPAVVVDWEALVAARADIRPIETLPHWRLWRACIQASRAASCAVSKRVIRQSLSFALQRPLQAYQTLPSVGGNSQVRFRAIATLARARLRPNALPDAARQEPSDTIYGSARWTSAGAR